MSNTLEQEQNSVLKSVEQNLLSVDVKRYLDENYDKETLFKRALTVFRSSYFGYESLDEKLYYELKLSEFVDTMKAIFELKDIQVKQVLEEIDVEIETTQQMVLQVRINDCRLENIKLSKAKLIAFNSIENTSIDLCLDDKENTLKSNSISFKLKFSQLKALRVEGKELQVALQVQGEDGVWKELPNKLLLPYHRIHPEGYRTWFSFDNNLECLVIIQFLVRGAYAGSRLSITEHTHFIWYLFRYRFKQHLKSTQDKNLLLSHQNNDKRTSSLHQEINLQEAFWPSNRNSPTATDMDISEIPVAQSSGEAMHCHELELAYDDTDEPIEEGFCRCSEWCNVSAFYYHNPMLRFLMVQFTNFYIRSNANLPSSYMCAISHMFAESSKDQNVPVLLLYLLNSIINYMKISYSKKIQFLAIDVCSYKFIRSVDVDQLVNLVHYKEPFDAEVVSCINSYFQIFQYLHSHVGKMSQIVPNSDIDPWTDLLFDTIYKGYNSYLYASTKKAIECITEYSKVDLFQNQNFSPKLNIYDYEDAIEEAVQERNTIYSGEFNQLNVKFACHPFIQIVLNISKYIVDIYLPLSSGEKKFQRCNFAIKFDSLLSCDLLNLIGSNGTHESVFSYLDQVDDPRIEVHCKKLYFMFALKLYSAACTIQQYFVTSLLAYNRVACYGYLMPVFSNLKFVFTCDWIERSIGQHFPMEFIYLDECPKLTGLIDTFYQSNWPLCQLTQPTDDQKTFNDILQECLKLSLWWKIDGKNLSLFRKIIELHQKIVSDYVVRADNVLKFEFSFIDNTNLCQESVLLKDKLASWLVESTCHQLTKVTYSLLECLHRLQSFTDRKCWFDFTLLRPGIIDLLATVEFVLQHLNKLQMLFFSFDDEVDSIRRCIQSAQFNITSIYRDVYVNIAWKWICQMEELIKRAEASGNSKVIVILNFSLIVGIHFVARFHRHFRRDFSEFRRKILKMEDKLRNLKGFNYNRYKCQVEEIYKFEINTNGSMPFLSESPEPEILDALEIKCRNKTPFDYLKQCNIDTDILK